MTDECDCGRCDVTDCDVCSEPVVRMTEHGDAFCQACWEEREQAEAEAADEDFYEKFHGGLNPYFYHGEEHEAARDAYWDARIDEERGK